MSVFAIGTLPLRGLHLTIVPCVPRHIAARERECLRGGVRRSDQRSVFCGHDQLHAPKGQAFVTPVLVLRRDMRVT